MPWYFPIDRCKSCPNLLNWSKFFTSLFRKNTLKTKKHTIIHYQHPRVRTNKNRSRWLPFSVGKLYVQCPQNKITLMVCQHLFPTPPSHIAPIPSSASPLTSCSFQFSIFGGTSVSLSHFLISSFGPSTASHCISLRFAWKLKWNMFVEWWRMYHSWLVIQFDILSKRVRDENFEYFQTFLRFLFFFLAWRTVYRPQPPRTFNFFRIPSTLFRGWSPLRLSFCSIRFLGPFTFSFWAKKI